MAITDKLRHNIEGAEQLYGREFPRLRAIVDRIDSAHEEALVSSYFDGVFSDGELAENGFMRLPKDADGEYIHVGDELRDEWNKQNQGEVEWLMLDHRGWWLKLKTSCERFYVHEFHEWHHHYKQPTVEDVLREFGKAWVEWEDGSPCDPIAEYAPKLRLAGDGE